MKVVVYFSSEAQSKWDNDKKIKGKRKEFHSEIFKLAKAFQGLPENTNGKIDVNTIRPSTKFGDFFTSPNSPRVSTRIAWRFLIDQGIAKVYIADLLYMEAKNRYSGNWGTKVTKGSIKVSDYKGYKEHIKMQPLA